MTRRIFADGTIVNATVTTTTELALTVMQVSGIKIGQGLLVFGTVEILTGANCSAVNVRVRELGGITGTIIGEISLEDTGMAGAHTRTGHIMFLANAFQDEPVYQLTVQQVDATGNATVNHSTLAVLRVD